MAVSRYMRPQLAAYTDSRSDRVTQCHAALLCDDRIRLTHVHFVSADVLVKLASRSINSLMDCRTCTGFADSFLDSGCYGSSSYFGIGSCHRISFIRTDT